MTSKAKPNIRIPAINDIAVALWGEIRANRSNHVDSERWINRIYDELKQITDTCEQAIIMTQKECDAKLKEAHKRTTELRREFKIVKTGIADRGISLGYILGQHEHMRITGKTEIKREQYKKTKVKK